MSQIISMSQVTKDYALGRTTVHALRGINISIDTGEFMSIVGPSGSGKTTLLNLIGCIDRATSGEVLVGGENVTKLSDKKITELRLFKIGFIFQTFNLIPVLNVRENIEFPLLLMKSIPKKELKARVQHWIDAVGLTDYAHHKPAELSGGQRQRVAIARALVTSPSIILADEPTANLDSVTGGQILDLMQTLNEQYNTTFIFSTHDQQVMRYAKRIIKIKDGLIDHSGEPILETSEPTVDSEIETKSKKSNKSKIKNDKPAFTGDTLLA